MKKTKILSLLLCLSLFCALIVPGEPMRTMSPTVA